MHIQSFFYFYFYFIFVLENIHYDGMGKDYHGLYFNQQAVSQSHGKVRKPLIVTLCS